MSELGVELGQGTGPLRGLKVVELAGIGPGPHACMLLADLGADVIRIDRPGGSAGAGEYDVLTRGRPSVALDLKNQRAVETVLDLVERADVLVEGMRPGTTERLGLGPADCWARNPRLVYGRMTGWGQDGPLAHTAGHDMNYLAVAGVLHGLGQDAERPHFPANLLGDFGGGSTYLVIGVLAAVFEAQRSGRGQVVDAAILDGAVHLNAMGLGLQAAGLAEDGSRAAGLLDGGVPYYDLYRTADGEHLSVAPLEGQFYVEFARLLELPADAPDRGDRSRLAELRALIAERISARTLAEWDEIFAGSDACVAGVLTVADAAAHPHNAAREVYVVRDGLRQPAPAPRFSRTEATLTSGPSSPGADTREALVAWGVNEVDELIADGAAEQL